MDLESLNFDGSAETHARWVQVFDKVLAGEMPPAKEPQPAAAEKHAFLTNIGGELDMQHMSLKGTSIYRQCTSNATWTQPMRRCMMR